MKTGRFRMTRCAVHGVEAVEADTAHSFGRHMHDQFGVGVILRGAQSSASGRGPVEAGPGDVITVNPGEVHDGHPIGEAGRAWRMLYFDPDLIAGVVADIAEEQRGDFVFSHPVSKDRSTARQFIHAYTEMTAPPVPEALAAESGLVLLIAAMMERRVFAGSPSPSVLRAQTMIDDDPTASVSLARLAREAGLSRFQLLRGFAKQNGITPHAYLVQRRIGLVRRMIASGVTLSDAALSSGFADQSHMTRTFVRAYGMTPGDYAAAFT